ncbi:MAG: hypothetical protein AAGF74_17720 [Pseudomonadota bacterium]
MAERITPDIFAAALSNAAGEVANRTSGRNGVRAGLANTCFLEGRK